MYFPLIVVLGLTTLSGAKYLFADSKPKIKLLQNIVDTQTPCHFHMVDKKRFKLDLKIQQPVSIDNHNKNYTSFPVTRVKGIYCVILLVIKLSSSKDNKFTSLVSITTKFREEFFKDFMIFMNMEIFAEDGSSYLLRRTVLIYVTSKSAPTKELVKMCADFACVYKTIAIIEFTRTKRLKVFRLNVSIKCLHCGKQLFLPASLNELFEIFPFDNTQKLTKKYNGNYFEILTDRLEVKYVLEDGRIPVFTEIRFLVSRFTEDLPITPGGIRTLTELFLLEEIFRNLNASVRTSRKRKNAPQVKRAMLSVYLGDEFNPAMIRILTRSPSFSLSPLTHSFLTCYHIPVIKYTFYFAPFHYHVWIGIVVSMVLLGLFLNFLIKRVVRLKYHSSFPVSMFMLSTITEDSCGMPLRLRKNWKIRFTLGPWFLVSVVFVNAYIGLVISSLTSPFKLSSIQSFSNLTKMFYSEEEINNNELWGNLFEEKSVKDKKHFLGAQLRSFDSDADFSIFSSITVASVEDARDPEGSEKFISTWVNLQYFWSIIVRLGGYIIIEKYHFGIKSISNILEHDSQLALNLVAPLHTFIPEDAKRFFNEKNSKAYSTRDIATLSSIIEKEITKCGKTVYADVSEEVDREFKYLTQHYPAIEFFKSKETFFDKKRFWVFQGTTEDSAIVQKMRHVLCSGIYDYLHRIFGFGSSPFRTSYTVSANKNSFRKNEPRPVSLEDRIQTCFVIYAISVSICLMCVVIEALSIYEFRLRFKMLLVEGLNHLDKIKVLSQYFIRRILNSAVVLRRSYRFYLQTSSHLMKVRSNKMRFINDTSSLE